MNVSICNSGLPWSTAAHLWRSPASDHPPDNLAATQPSMDSSLLLASKKSRGLQSAGVLAHTYSGYYCIDVINWGTDMAQKYETMDRCPVVPSRSRDTENYYLEYRPEKKVVTKQFAIWRWNPFLFAYCCNFGKVARWLVFCFWGDFVVFVLSLN